MSGRCDGYQKGHLQEKSSRGISLMDSRDGFCGAERQAEIPYGHKML